MSCWPYASSNNICVFAWTNTEYIVITYASWNIYLHYVQEASLQYVFGYRSNLDLFSTRFKDAAKIYQYLNYQPHPLGKQWIMSIVTFVDGLDIRFRALEIDQSSGLV